MDRDQDQGRRSSSFWCFWACHRLFVSREEHCNSWVLKELRISADEAVDVDWDCGKCKSLSLDHRSLDCSQTREASVATGKDKAQTITKRFQTNAKVGNSRHACNTSNKAIHKLQLFKLIHHLPSLSHVDHKTQQTASLELLFCRHLSQQCMQCSKQQLLRNASLTLQTTSLHKQAGLPPAIGEKQPICVSNVAFQVRQRILRGKQDLENWSPLGNSTSSGEAKFSQTWALQKKETFHEIHPQNTRCLWKQASDSSFSILAWKVFDLMFHSGFEDSVNRIDSVSFGQLVHTDAMSEIASQAQNAVHGEGSLLAIVFKKVSTRMFMGFSPKQFTVVGFFLSRKKTCFF